MAKKGGGLRLDLLDKMFNRLDDIYDKIIKVNFELDKVEKTKLDKSLVKNFGALAQNLDKLSLAVRQMGTGPGDNFSILAKNMREGVKTLNQINLKPTLKKATDLGAVIKKLTSAMSSDNIGDGGEGGGKKLVKLLFPIAEAMGLFDRFKKGDGLEKTAEKVKKSLDSIKDIVAVVGSIPDAGKAIESITVLKTVMNELMTLFDRVARDTQGADSGAGKRMLFGFSTFIGELFSVFKILGKASPGVMASAFDSFKSLLRDALPDFLANLGKTFHVLSEMSWLEWRRSFVRFEKFMNNVIKPLGEIGKLMKASQGEAVDPQAFSRVFSSLGALIKAALAIVHDLGKMSIFSGLPFGELGKGFRRFRAMVKIFMEPLRVDAEPKKIEALARFFKAMTDALHEIMLSIKDMTTMEIGFRKAVAANIKIRILLNSISGAMSGIANKFKGTSLEAIKGIAGMVRAFGQVLQPLRLMMKEAGAVGFVKANLTTIKMKMMFKSFANMLKSLTKVTKGMSPEKALVSAKLFSALGKLITALKKSLDDPPSKGKLAAVKASFGELSDIFKVFGNVKTKKADVAERVIKSLIDVFALLEKLKNVDVDIKVPTGSFEKFQPLLDSISKLKVFKDARKNIESLVKLAPLLKELGGGGFGGVGGGIEDTNKSLEKTSKTAKEVRQGIIGAYVKIKLFEVGFKALSKVAKTTFKILSGFSGAKLFTSSINALKKLSSAVKQVGDQLRDIGEKIRTAGQSLITNFGVGKLFGSGAFKAATAFDKIGTQLEVFGGLTKEARESAEAFSFEIGKKYPLSANDALAATLNLIKAGQKLGDVRFILPAAADLAALSDTGDLDTTVNTLIAAQATFSKFSKTVAGTFTNIAIAANIISAGADISTASVESLGQGLANVGPAADAFGLTMEETVAILAIFDQNAIRGAEGGTALRSMLNALSRPATQRTLESLENRVRGLGGEFSNLSLSMFTDDGQRRPINDLISDMGRALNALNPEEQAAMMQQLADTFGRQGLQILLNQGADGIDNMVAAMFEVDPVSQRAAEMLDNLAGDVVQLQGSFETLLTKALLPLIDRFARPFVKFARLTVDALLALDKRVLTFISTMIALGSIIVTIIGFLLIFGGAIIQIGGMLLIFVGGALNVVNVFALLVAGAVTTLVAIASLIAIFAFLLPVLIAVTSLFEGVFQIFSEDLGGARTATIRFFTVLKNTLVGVGSALLTIFASIGSFLKRGRSEISPLERVGETIAAMMWGMTAFLQTGIIGKFRDGLQDLASILKTVVSAFTLPARMNDAERTVKQYARRFGEDLTGIDDLVQSARIRISESYQEMISDLVSNNKLLRRIFGDRLTTRAVQSLMTALGEIGSHLSSDLRMIGWIFGAFARNVRSMGFFTSFGMLIEDLDTGFGMLTATFLTGFQTLFNVDFSNEIDIALSRSGGFGSAISSIFSRVVGNLRQQAIDNRKNLRKIFIKVIEFFLSPVKAIGFFGKVFGIQALEDFAKGFNTMMGKVFGGIFDFVFNLLEGQSFEEAAVNAFGDAVTPIVNFVEELGRMAGLIVEIIGNIIGALFNFGDSGAGNSFGDAVESIFSALSDGLKMINDLILKPLSEGDIIGAVSNLLPLLLNLIKFIGEGLLNLLSSIDVSQIFLDVAGGIFELLFVALGSGVEELGKILDIDVSSILDTIGSVMESGISAIEAGGVGGVFTLVADAIVGLFAVAIETSFAVLGSFLNFDTDAILSSLDDSIGGLLRAIESLFIGEDGTNLFDSIGKIIDTLIDAIESFFDLFSSGSGSDTSATEAGASAIKKVAEAIGFLITAGIDYLTLMIDELDRLFELLAEMDPEGLFALGASFFVLAGGLGATATALTAAGAAALKAAGFLAVLLVIKAVVENMDKVLEIFEELGDLDIAGAIGDFFDAVGNIFNTITFDVLSLFGIDEIFGKSREDMEELISSLGGQIGLILRGLGNIFWESIQRMARRLGEMFLDFRIWLNNALHDLNLGLSDAGLIQADVLLGRGDVDLGGVITRIEEDKIHDMGDLRLLARANVEDIVAAFAEEYANADTDEMASAIEGLRLMGVWEDVLQAQLDSENLFVLSNMVLSRVLSSEELGSVLDLVISKVAIGELEVQDSADMLAELYAGALFADDEALQRRITEYAMEQGIVIDFSLVEIELGEDLTEHIRQEAIATFTEDLQEDLAGEDVWNSIIESVGTAFASGLSGEDIAYALFTMEGYLDLTPAQVDILLTYGQDAARVVAEGAAMPLEDPDIVLPVIDTDMPEKAEGQLYIEADLVIVPGEVTLAEDAEIFDEAQIQELVEIDLDRIVDPEVAAELNEEIRQLITRLGLLQDEFGETQPLFGTFVDNMNAAQTAIVDVTTEYEVLIATMLLHTFSTMPIMAIGWRLTMLQVMDDLITKINRVSIGFPLMANRIMASILRLTTGPGLNPLIHQLRILDLALKDVSVDAMRALASILLFFGGQVPGTVPEGLAKGGPFGAGSIHEVIEGGQSEVLEQNGKFFLIAGQSGQVIPLSGLPSTTLATMDSLTGGALPMQGSGGSSFVDNSTIMIDMGGVVVGDVGGEMSGIDLIDRIEVLLEENREMLLGAFSTNDQLRSGHRK